MKTSILNSNSVMDARDHFKNGANPKSQTSRGYFKIKQAFFVMFVAVSSIFIFNSCDPNELDEPNNGGGNKDSQNTLSVGSSSLSFSASETATKTTTVTTNASSWNFNCSASWLKVEKQGNTLKVTPNSANTGSSQRTASITVSAGTAKNVTVQVTQGVSNSGGNGGNASLCAGYQTSYDSAKRGLADAERLRQQFLNSGSYVAAAGLSGTISQYKSLMADLEQKARNAGCTLR